MSERPEAESDANRIRAELIVHCVMGGCDDCRVPPKGVRVVGAWIKGEIDLSGCSSPYALRLFICHLDTVPFLRDAYLHGLYLSGSKTPGIDAQRLRCESNVQLNRGFEATGPVTLNGMRIKGQFACTEGKFDGKGARALDLEAAIIEADVLLREGFSASGTVAANRARIGGGVSCLGGSFDGRGSPALETQAAEIGADVFLTNGFEARGVVDLQRAQIKGNLQCHGGTFSGGLVGAAMKVSAGFFLRDLKAFSGPLYLTDAEIGRLEDDLSAWEQAEALYLSGFRYKRLGGNMRVSDRLRQLDRVAQHNIAHPKPRNGSWIAEKLIETRPNNRPSFDPQPYSQLAKVLREQGKASDAARVLEARDHRLATTAYDRAIVQFDGSRGAFLRFLWAPFGLFFSRAFGWIFGYGHKPARSLIWVIALLLCTASFYNTVWNAGQFAPTSDVVLASQPWIDAVVAHETDPSQPMPLQAWLKTPSAQDYESFSHWLYAFDVFIPLDALGQETAWAPSPARGDLGWWGFYLKPVIQIAGWVITAIGAAAVAGLVGKRD
ncbi:hypothetical protein [Primorskyibacter sp. S187A]|uniref:hypothetical protein n=1 Tax=Primorskyibacter sp. S187A TaxID=3415130 RepID=UPI003C7E6935